MEQARLQVQARKGKGKGAARATRRAGLVPGIIYGHKLEPMLIQFPQQRLHRLLSLGGENVLINMDIDNSGTETVMLKEVQVDPVTRMILHADFVRVSLEERVTTHVPITLVGSAAGVSIGGILEFLHRELRVECQVGQIPEHVELDVSSLGIGDQIRVGDLKLAEGVTILDDPATTIAVVVPPTIIKEEEEAEAVVVEEEEKEPEVIERRRKEEEEVEEQ